MDQPDRPGLPERRCSFNPNATVFSPPLSTTSSDEPTATASEPSFSYRVNVHHPGQGHSLWYTEPLWFQNIVSTDSRHEVMAQGAGGYPLALEGTASNEQLLHQGTRESPDFLSYGSGPHSILLRKEGQPPAPDVGELAAHLGLPGSSREASSRSPVRTHETRSMQTIQDQLPAPDVGELAVHLGLPGPFKEAPPGSPVRARETRSMQTISGRRAGKLLERALDTPLTASTLAQYLTNRSDSSEDTTMPSREIWTSNRDNGHHTEEQPHDLHLVHPPPGYAGEPRMVTKDDNRVAPLETVKPRKRRTAPAAYFKQLRPNTQSAASLQQYIRLPSSRNRSGRQAPIRRTDQGPEASAADIYPDDTQWTPLQANQFNYLTLPPGPHVSLQTGMHVNDATSWPTPAEMYTHQAFKQPVTGTRQPFNIFDNHVRPTTGDINAADGDVIALLENLPLQLMGTSAQLEAHNLPRDDRPLTPGQESGSHYGLGFAGIGLKDPWICPTFSDGSSWENPAPFGG